jgi:ubiquinone/menaquinone biosynthesis C-methylase UbiE
VGDRGKVYAVDVSPDMIRHINRRIRELKATNVVSILADPDDPLLPDASVDRFFFSDSWHHIDSQTKYLSLMKKMLKRISANERAHLPAVPVFPDLCAKIDRTRNLNSTASVFTAKTEGPVCKDTALSSVG